MTSTTCAATGCTYAGTEPWVTAVITPAGVNEQLLVCREHAAEFADGRHVSFDRTDR